jgi:hypothetical protein
VNFTAGTKGGRGHRVDRWVPVSGAAISCLARAAKAQEQGRNLIPADLSWRQRNSKVHHAWSAVRDDYGLKKIYDLRAAYACERYKQLTGSAAPVVAGRRHADKSAARQTIAQELGRLDAGAQYQCLYSTDQRRTPDQKRSGTRGCTQFDCSTGCQ